ncbi:claudin domain-containing protein 2 [Sarcophilus harrisii]
MGVKRSLQSAGLCLGILANVLVVLATSTDFWSRFSDGHNGLWRLCRRRNCTNSPCESEGPSPRGTGGGGGGHSVLPASGLGLPSPSHTMLAATAACVVLAAGSGLLASTLAVRVLLASRTGNLIPPRGRNACLVFFLSGRVPSERSSPLKWEGPAQPGPREGAEPDQAKWGGGARPSKAGEGAAAVGRSRGVPRPPSSAHAGLGVGAALLLLAGMVGYTARDAWKADSFFSWSYFIAWLALPFSILAGFCFLFADMILQSTDAISGFPVCL